MDLGLPWGLSGKEFACSVGDAGDVVPSLSWEDPWRRAWQPTPVFLPGESHGQKRLVAYGLYGYKQSNMTDVTEHTQTHPWIALAETDDFHRAT